MRDTFIDELKQCAEMNKQVILITGDLGFGVLDAYRKALPTQFINAGIAEQNMTGLAAGLALEGKIVFTYSIANFPTLRCLEQIRNDVAYHNANVKIVAVGGGFSYGALGMSHHATEDVGILRALPNIKIYAPCDDTETRAVTRQMLEERGPAYLRLDKSKVESSVTRPYLKNTLRCLREGKDISILGYGGILAEALKAADRLAAINIDCGVYSVHTIKPVDRNAVVELARTAPGFVVVEEHVRTGGLASQVADIMLESGVMPRYWHAITLPDEYSAVVGSQEYLRSVNQVDAKAIEERITKLMRGVVSC